MLMEYHRTKIIPKCIVTTSLFSSSICIYTHRSQKDRKSMWFGRKEAAESTVAIYFSFTPYIHTCTYTQIYLYISPKSQNSCGNGIFLALQDKIVRAFPLPSTATVYTLQLFSCCASTNLGTEPVSKQPTRYTFPY